MCADYTPPIHSSSRRSWEDLRTLERDYFLLAAFGGPSEWQPVMENLGLDRVEAARIANAMSPLAQPPKSIEERSQREQDALTFLANRPLGSALKEAIGRRDGSLDMPIEEAAAQFRARDGAPPDVRTSPFYHPTNEMRPRYGHEGQSPRGGVMATLETVLKAVRNTSYHMLRALSGISKRHLLPRIKAIGGAIRTGAGETFSAVATRMGITRSIPLMSMAAENSDGITPTSDQNLREASVERWRKMGETIKAMTVASALRGYPPALEFIRIIAPDIGPFDDSKIRVSPRRYRHIQGALKRGDSLFYRAYRWAFPPEG
ncbi:conserved hypothetical protein [Candidatus Terasakiella magnetica]|nr:conserved hypothetical protein [Candidatus Terasakiella magnetica]